MRGRRSALLLFAGLVGHLKIVGDAEDARYASRAHAGNVLVRLASDLALQDDVAAQHNDTNGLDRVKSVSVEGRISINRTIEPQTELIVHRRGRVDLNVIDDIGDPGEAADKRNGRIRGVRFQGMATQGDNAVVARLR